MTAREVLDGIKERLGAITPGPWVWSEETYEWGDCGPNLETVERGPRYSDGSQGAESVVIGSWGHDANGISIEPADAVFIASAPSTVARLTGALEAVLAVADDLEASASRSSYRDNEWVTAAWLESASLIRAAIENALEGE